MIKNKKVAYTLDQKVIDIINEMSIVEKKSKSKCLADCIKRGYGTMLEDYYDNDEKPYNYTTGKRRKNTIAKTFTLPIYIVNDLDWFSKKLGMKKSHLIIFCVLNYERPKSNLDQIDKIMDDCVNMLEVISIRSNNR
jgi:hypothetical protein